MDWASALNNYVRDVNDMKYGEPAEAMKLQETIWASLSVQCST